MITNTALPDEGSRYGTGSWLEGEKRVMRRRIGTALMSAVVLVGLAACGSATKSDGGGGGTGSSKHSGTYKVALSLSYTGNDWQNEAANLVKAAAKTAPYNKKVSLRVDIAGADVTKQIQTLNNEISAGVNAIIVYPISPTALNATIQKACNKKIVVYAYDSLVTAPCAYNVHIDQYEWGIYSATWLAKELNGKGKIADISGVPGTTVDSDRQKALKDVLKKYPGITIAGTANGAWAQAQGKTAFASIQSGHPDLDGVYAEAACYSITQYLISSGKKSLPCAGEMENGVHIYMLSPEVCKKTGIPSSQCIHLRGSSAGSPVYSGELALINAVRILDGEKVAHDIVLPLPKFDTDDLDAAGTKAVGENPAEGALVFPPSKVSNPGFFGDFWNPLVEQGLNAALNGTSDKISTAKTCDQVTDCKAQEKLIFDKNHSGGN
jgi:ribose transport system substrate-binding protein